jgi:hypothetical protein
VGSSAEGVCFTIGVVAAEISRLGFDLGISALGVGVASVLFEESPRVPGTASWARANGDPVSATLTHRPNLRIPFLMRIAAIIGSPHTNTGVDFGVKSGSW